MPFNIGPGELILILVIALVVLGPSKLPDVAQSLGRSLREFRKAASDVTDAAKVDAPAPAATSSATPPSPTTPAAAAAPAASEPAAPGTAAAPPVEGSSEMPVAAGASKTPDSSAS